MKKPIFEQYATQVAKHFHLSMDSLFEKSKRRNQVDARQVLYLLCMERPIQLILIKQYLEDHGYVVPMSTISHGYERAKKLVESDEDYAHVVNEIKNNV
jgi:chromosomal replication initiation ATPase DnaA|tara:strand:- start:1651 stop:1947 length:297 start_codon:yes stop_codon:yes gene_type:complete